MEGNKVTVCVTGGTGFVASWLIMRLLDHGYSVNTTIRPQSEDTRDVSFLISLPGASDKLQIFEADLNDPGSFDSAIKDCVGVFHVATPIDFEKKESEEVVTKRAIDGTLGILKSCLNSKTVKKVVYTSSQAAAIHNDSGVDLMDESFWTDVGFVKGLDYFRGSYAISKTLTEKRALEFAEEHGLDLVTLLPSYIVGPFICPNLPGSVRASLCLVFGDDEMYNDIINVSMVHTDDVARAHIFLFENPDAKGRYICTSRITTLGHDNNILWTEKKKFSCNLVQIHA